MPRRFLKHHDPVHKRHKVFGIILAALGLICFGGCLLLTAYLLDHFLAGRTMELIFLDFCLGVGGIIFILLAWQQLVYIPRRERLEDAFQPLRQLREREGGES